MFKTIKNSVLILALFTGMTFIGEAKADPGTHIRPEPNLNKVIEFDEQFDYGSVSNLIEDIQDSIDEGDKVINIGLNSPGGSILAGTKLIHKIMFWQSKGIKFRGIVREMCASMCFSSLQFLDIRLSYPLSMFLDHSASGGDNKAALRQYEELLDAKVDARLKAAGKKKSEIKLYRLMVLNEFFFNSHTALGLGLIDKIIIPGSEEVKNDKVEPKPAANK